MFRSAIDEYTAHPGRWCSMQQVGENETVLHGITSNLKAACENDIMRNKLASFSKKIPIHISLEADTNHFDNH